MTLKFNSIHGNALSLAGLSSDQAEVYEALLKQGSVRAGQLPRRLGISRPQAYKILDDLINLGLATKEESPGKPAKFVPVHPFALQALLRKQQEQLDIAKYTVQGVMTSLISDYTNSSHVPGIRVIPDLDGIKELYGDVIGEKNDICLIRSTMDDDSADRRELVLAHIRKQVSSNIKTRLIGPLPTGVTLQELAKRDASRLTSRKVFDRERFSLPAQIMIYGNKVGITSYEEPLMTTIIENKAIRETFSTIFEIMWGVAKTPEEYT